MAKPFEHNGQKYTNADAWRTAKATQAPMAATPAPGGEMGGEEQPEQVVQQHGPAIETHTQHEHEMGTHHAHSVHADGYEHHSDHGSAEEAHEHLKKLTGHHEEKPEGEPEEHDDWDEDGE